MDTKSLEQTVAKRCRCWPIPARYVLCAMAATGNMLSFSLKVSLSVAIVAMVKPSHADSADDGTSGDLAGGGSNNQTAAAEKAGGYDWSEMTQSAVLSGLQYGGLFTCLVGARLAEVIGPRHISGPALGIASVLHLLCPLVAPWGAAALIALRVVQGLFTGAFSPGVSTLLLRWVPFRERGVIISIVFTAVNAGILFSMALTGKICTDWGWRAVFYFYGGLGCFWTVLWMLLVFNSPIDHPRICAEEKEFILANVAKENKVSFPVPWLAILTSLPVWSYVAVIVGVVYVLYMFLTELPTYMKDILNFNLASSGYLSALPYVFCIVTNIMMGSLSQWLRSKGHLSHVATHKIFNGIGMLGPAAMMICITQVEDAATIIVLVILTMVLQGGFFGGSLVNHLELSPNFAATISGLSDILAEGMSILAPTVVGAITNGEETRDRWQLVFYISSAIISFPYLMCFLFGSVKEQSWNKPREERNKDRNMSKVVAA